jgi:hypothetical protein
MNLNTLPPLAPGEAVVLLPYDQYWYLGECTFRLVRVQQGQVEVFEPFEGQKGYRQLTLPMETLNGLLIKYQGILPVGAGPMEGAIFLKQYREATVRADSPLLLAQ